MVVLKWFLNFDDFEHCDSNKKDIDKKGGVRCFVFSTPSSKNVEKLSKKD